MPWPLVRAQCRRGTALCSCWGWRLSLSHQAQNYLLTGYYPAQCRTHTKEKPLFETTINRGEQVSSLIIKTCYLGGIRAGKDSPSHLLISPVIPTGMIQNPSEVKGFDISFLLHSPMIPRKSLSHERCIHCLINCHYCNVMGRRIE